MTDFLTDHKFETLYTDGVARIGNLMTPHGDLNTPVTFPVHNLGAYGGWNTPRYWEVFPDIQTAMFNAFSLISNHRSIRDKLEFYGGIHDFLGFNGVAFVDSGGYLGLNSSLNVDQDEILHIQKMVGADIAATLDFPFDMKYQSGNNARIARSVENAVRARRSHTENGMLLYASVHGDDPITLRNVLKFLKKRETFDGFAIGSLVPIRSDFRRVIDLVISARSAVKDSPLHVFGLGGLSTTPLLIYLGVDSSDSTSYIICGGKRRYFIPGYREISMKNLENYGALPCNCPICSSKSLEEVRGSRSLISLHNIWALWSEIKMAKYAISEGRLEKYLTNRYAENPVLKSAFEYAKMKQRHLL